MRRRSVLSVIVFSVCCLSAVTEATSLSKVFRKVNPTVVVVLLGFEPGRIPVQIGREQLLIGGDIVL
ncbi:MAG: hypothetical protein JSU72_00870 [Deltaproteobacteria bacterium]|nr:MAG: hypothetical protein JSU72_00870 [Deltaproteobacteria bacterium]